MKPILETVGLRTHYGGGRPFLGRPRPLVRAVDGIDLRAAPGESLGIVGESGCGKSTLARTLLGLERETEGDIVLKGRQVSGLDPRAARVARAALQYVHQDPGAALDPWWRIGAALDETLRIHGVTDKAERTRRISEMLDAVGLNDGFRDRYPHELSGGQQRRVGLARTLSLRPEVVILDEPTSGLDLSVQAGVLRLMADLRAAFGLTYLFISHDLSVVERVCDRVAIMYLGRIVEIGTTAEVFAAPRHPYTRALLAAAPTLSRKPLADPVAGEPPSAARMPPGCAFHTRCPHAQDGCRAGTPPGLQGISATHEAACPPLLRAAAA